MFNLFRHRRKGEISFNIVAKNGNNVEATFDTVERIVQLVAFDNVASTLLLVWTGLNNIAMMAMMMLRPSLRLTFPSSIYHTVRVSLPSDTARRGRSAPSPVFWLHRGVPV